MYRRKFYLIGISLVFLTSIETLQKAKDNGDIYVVDEETFIKDIKQQMRMDSSLHSDISTPYMGTTTSLPENSNTIHFDELISLCNSSFYIPMHYYEKFNRTAALPDLVDKTGMCFVRCLYEKSGLIENWKLNAEKIRANIWPASNDTIEMCDKEGGKEKNACVRAYGIARCLTLRYLADART